MKSLFALLLLLLFYSGCDCLCPDPPENPGASDPDDVLLMIQSLSRHGDRAAQNDPWITPTAPIAFYRGPGELTDSGIRNAVATGKAYRERYVNTGFLDGRFLPTEATFRASAVNRVLMTSGHFASGLFRTPLLEPVHSPIYTEPYLSDPLLAINFNCLNGWEDVADRCGIDDTSDMANKLLECMRRTEWECGQDPPPSQSDTVIAEMANPLTKIFLTPKQISCAQDPALKFMFRYIQSLGGSGPGYNASLVRLQRSVGNLVNSIVSNFQKRHACHRDNVLDTCEVPKAIFNLAHDVNLLSLMNVVSYQEGAACFFRDDTPAYAASIVMELWSRRGTPFIRMYVKNGAAEAFREFRYCDHLPAEDFPRIDGLCTLETLEKATKLYITQGEALCVSRPPCCAPNGTWSEWTTTGTCSTTCGSCSVAPRTRVCMSKVDGCPCNGPSSDTGPCGIAPCVPGNCCGNYAVLSKNGNTLETFCGHGDTPNNQVECSPTNCCPSGGIWSEWSSEGTCATTCGSCSTLTRTRTCVSAADGCPCFGSSMTTGPCGTDICPSPGVNCCYSYKSTLNYKTGTYFCGDGEDVRPPKVPCCPAKSNTYWAQWGEWSSTCLTTGGRTRIRACNGADKGCECDGPSSETEQCCCPEGGVWSEWSAEGTCATTCGSCTTMSRRRTCASEQFGCPCTGESSDTGPCNTAPCTGSTICCSPYSVKINPNSGLKYCGDAVTEAPLIGCCTSENQGSMNPWTEWAGSDCKTAKCGLCDTLLRSRICTPGPIGCPCDLALSDTERKGCGNNSLCSFPERTCCAPYVKSLIFDVLVCA